MTHTKGLIAAPFTPMHSNGAINPEIIPAYYEMLKANHICGAFICGSTGEGVSLTTEEKKIIIQAWANLTARDDDFRLMVLIGGNCLADCIELATFAENAVCDAISFTSPSYFKPASVKAIANMCAEIAQAAPSIPLYYYHIPVLTGAHFSMLSLLQEVHEKIPNFEGIKYTHEDFMDFLNCLHFENGRYDMLWGRDENMLAALALGATGAVGSTFNYLAPVYHTLIKSYEQGNLAEAREWQQISIDLIMLLGKYGGISTGKAFMKLLGLDCGEFRLPVTNMTPDQFKNFEEEARLNGFFKYSSRLALEFSS